MKQVLLWFFGLLFFMALVTGTIAFLKSANNFKYCFFICLLIVPYAMFELQKQEKIKDKNYSGRIALLGMSSIVMGIVVFLNIDTMKERLAHEIGVTPSVVEWTILIFGGLSVASVIFLFKQRQEKL